MGFQERKLANVLFKIDSHATEYPELYFRSDAESASCDTLGGFRSHAPVDFLTYVNALSAGKWHRYTGIERAVLRLRISGRGSVCIKGVPAGEDGPVEIDRLKIDWDAPRTVESEVSLVGYDLIGFILEPAAGEELVLSEGCFLARVEKEDVNPVRLALSTTTFNNEEFILPNIDLVKKGVAAEGEPMASHFHMFVVDNGRTLDAEGLSDDMVTVLSNPNVGGAGGFARGMIEAARTPGSFTHVLLMDDDVRIMPESLIRTFNLLSLAKGKYRDAFLNGAMLSLEDPTRQYEDVSYVPESGIYHRVKEDLDMGKLSDIIKNERIDVEVPKAYGAWWYSCIPVKAIEKNGLPAPFFVRCDDVEFGMRNNPLYMTMNGIGVWHASFEGRWRASVDCYQYTRNFLAMIAFDDCSSESVFMMRFTRSMRRHLRDLDYPSAEMLLKGLEDYLKGPRFLESADGAALMKENGACNEKLTPVGEMDPALLREAGVDEEVLSRIVLEMPPSTPFMKLWRSVPYDKHYLPDFLLDKKLGYIVKQGTVILEGSSLHKKSLLYLDPRRKSCSIRTVDKERFRQIRKRQHALMRQWRRDGKRIRAEYKAALPRLTSREYWCEKLGISV